MFKETIGVIKRVSGRLLVAMIPALLLGAYARWPALAFLPYFALVPWMVLYTDDRRRRISWGYYFLAAYVTWLLMHAPFFAFGWYPPLAMGVVFYLPWLPFAPLLQGIHHRLRLPRTVTVPIVWVTVEWIRATFTLAKFDAFLLGYSQAPFTGLIQIADITGVYGVSFLVAAVNGLLADAFFALRDQGWSVARVLRTRRVILGVVAVAAGFALVSLYGAYRLANAENTEGPRVAVVQPNVRHSLRGVAGVHLSQLLLTDTKVGASEAELIVWPENAILDPLRRGDAYLADLAWLADRKKALVLLGATGESEEYPGRGTNSAFLVDRGGTILARYDKQVLFPWSEYMPLDDLLSWLAPPIHRLHRMVSRAGWGSLATGVAGSQMTLFSLPWKGEELRFGTLICGENINAQVAAEAGVMGARFLVHITSEGLLGRPAQEQALRACILRAVENRIPYVRSCNTGISCFIDGAGRVQSVLRGEHGRLISDAGVLIDNVPLASGVATRYARSGDAFAKACGLATVVLLLWGFLRTRSAMEG